MKRSMQVGLVVMGALGVTTAGGTYLANRGEECRQRPEQPCQSSRGGGGGGHAIFGPSSSAPATSPSAPGSSAPGSSAQRGGFGSIGHGISGHSASS